MYKNIVILTGAGISAESGLATFRDSGGLWANFKVEDVATPAAYAKAPAKVQEFYNFRRKEAANAQPNPAHIALAKLEKEFQGSVLVVTQNVDDLHERAGTKNLLHMHGELNKTRCTSCHTIFETKSDCSMESVCQSCGKVGTIRPHIVWFGEIPLYMNEINKALFACDLFVSIGTSGNVYPAAGFVKAAKESAMAETVELNMEESLVAQYFDRAVYGKAGEIVPKFVDDILKKQSELNK